MEILQVGTTSLPDVDWPAAAKRLSGGLSHVATKICFISGAFCLQQNAHHPWGRAARPEGQATSGKAVACLV